jgi:hypothetical protein
MGGKWSKIKESIANKTFAGKVNDRVILWLLGLVTRNKNAAIYAKQCIVSKKLKKRYSKILTMRFEDRAERASNKVWVCWFQGYEKAPELVKACFNSLKENMPGKEIIFLSEENLAEYIVLPDYIQKKYAAGNISRAHYSDIIRIALLCEHGGMWVDSTVLCTSKEMAQYISSLPLFAYKQADLTHADQRPTAASSWLIAGHANNKILLLTRELLYAYWKENNYTMDYFLVHMFFKMATDTYSELWSKVPTYYNAAPHTMHFELDHAYTEERWKQLLAISGFHKLNHHLAYQKENTIYGHVLETYAADRV